MTDQPSAGYFATLRGLALVQTRQSANGFRRGGAFVWLKLLSGVVFGAFFLAWIYFIFERVLTYFTSIQLMGTVLAERLLSLLFLTVFALVFFSNVVVTISTAFLSTDLNLLMALPLRRSAVVTAKFLESWLSSAWMPALLFLPILAAYGAVFRGGWLFGIVSFGVLTLFLALPAALGFSVTTLLMRFFPARQIRDSMLLLGVLGLAVVSVVLRMSRPEVFTQSSDQLGTWSQYLEELRTPAAPYLPGAWATQAVLGALYQRTSLLLAGLGKLLGIGLPLGWAFLALSSRFFEKGWYNAQESVGLPAPRRGRVGPWLNRLFGFLPPPLRALLVKDLLVFSRDPTQWAQLSLLLSLIGVYLYNYRRIPLDAYADYRNLIFFLSMGFSGFIVSAVGVRYIFPTVSLEGRSFWIIRSSPLTIRGILWGKFLLAFLPMTALSLAVMGVSIQVMKVDLFMATLSLGTMAILALGLTALGVGLGGVFTYFKSDNASQISTSLGGYVYVMASVTFISLVLLVEATPVRVYYLRHPEVFRTSPWEAWVPALYLAGVVAAAVILPLALGERRLTEQEI